MDPIVKFLLRRVIHSRILLFRQGEISGGSVMEAAEHVRRRLPFRGEATAPPEAAGMGTRDGGFGGRSRQRGWIMTLIGIALPDGRAFPRIPGDIFFVRKVDFGNITNIRS